MPLYDFEISIHYGIITGLINCNNELLAKTKLIEQFTNYGISYNDITIYEITLQKNEIVSHIYQE